MATRDTLHRWIDQFPDRGRRHYRAAHPEPVERRAALPQLQAAQRFLDSLRGLADPVLRAGLTPPRAASPRGHCDVLLTFDVDGPSGFLHQNPEVARRPSIYSQAEYGPTVGMPKILALLHDHDIRASFFIPGWEAERHPDLVRRIVDAGHEIGHHGYLHEPPASLDRDQEAAVLDRTSAILERLASAPPRGYRSPGWELSEHSLGLLADRGFLYDSSLMGDDVPYLVGEEGRRLVEIPIDWAFDDYPYFGINSIDFRRPPASPPYVFDAWAAAFQECYRRGLPFILTMHPWIIARPGRLRMLDRLIRHMRSFPRVRFRRAIDLATDFATAHTPPPSEPRAAGD